MFLIMSAKVIKNSYELHCSDMTLLAITCLKKGKLHSILFAKCILIFTGCILIFIYSVNIIEYKIGFSINLIKIKNSVRNYYLAMVIRQTVMQNGFKE